ncbi:MAG: XdhC family protein [Clostridia bacterium]
MWLSAGDAYPADSAGIILIESGVFPMQSILNDIITLLAAGEPFVLATIIRNEGSSPRGTGACMLMTQDGMQKGTIGGGAVEYAAGRHAVELFATKCSETQLFTLNPNAIADLGMICGGRIWVLFQHFAANEETKSLFMRLKEATEQGRQAYLVRKILDGAVIDTGVYDALGLHFSERMDVLTVREHLAPRAVMVEYDAAQLLVEPVTQVSRVYVFGGGHVSQKLVPILKYVDFRVTVCEDRFEFADKALFPAAENTVLCPFTDIFAQITLTEHDYVIIMTRGHQADFEILRQTLKTDATYIGCIGSRHKIALTKQRLLDEGFTEKDFARVHTPIGLPILAETPEEIAISVAAELIAHRASLCGKK